MGRYVSQQCQYALVSLEKAMLLNIRGKLVIKANINIVV
jgi:hypothetical protein